MSANSVDGMLRAAAERQQQVEQAQNMMNAQLRGALDNPHMTTRYRVHMSGILTEDASTVILFGLPTGERLEFEMASVTAQQLANALVTTLEEDSEQAA